MRSPSPPERTGTSRRRMRLQVDRLAALYILPIRQ